MNSNPRSLNRRHFLTTGIAAAGLPALGLSAQAQSSSTGARAIVTPPEGKRILLGCKLSMITRESDGKKLSAGERLAMARQAGFDGVDFDQAGEYTVEQARAAVQESGMFVHNAINHAHWEKRLTSADATERAAGSANLAHCIRVSHAAGGSGVLLVIGRADDGPADVIEERCRVEIQKNLPLAAALGQPILIENVWNKMFYNHDAPPDQGAEPFVRFVDSFRSPWVGMYYDIGNHWKYGQPRDWLRAFGHRCVKLDIKGFSRAENKFKDIGQGDLPWDQVLETLAEIGFSGWATAEVGGGGLERLTLVRKQMQQALGA